MRSASFTLATLIPPFLYVAQASAQDAIVDFNIPRGSLGNVVNAIAAAGGQSISFPAAVAYGRMAGPIRGRMSVRAALGQVLAGSSLRTEEKGGVLTIVPTTGNRAVGGVNANDATDVLDIDVIGTRTGDQGFVAGATASSTRIEGSIQNTPQSITGITKDVLTTQAQTSVADSLTNVSGITASPADGNAATPNFTIRGVSNNGTLLINGQNVGGVSIPITQVERIDVVKGPSGILTGPATEGGAVNILTKQPTSTPVKELSLYFGSFGYKTIAFDLGGPVPQTEGLTYRFLAAGNTADQNYGGYKRPNDISVFPQLRWEDAKTQVQIGVNLIQQRILPTPYAFYATPTQIYNVGRTQIIGNADSHSVTRTIQPNLSAQRDLGVIDLGYFGHVDLTVHSRNLYTFNTFDGSLLQPAAILQGPALYILGYSSQRSNTSSASTQNDLTLKWETQYVRDTIRLGVDERFGQVVTRATYQSTPSPSTPIPISNLGFASNYPLLGRPTYPPNFSAQNDVGLSIQDNVDVFDRLHIVGAVRKDEYNQSSNFYTVKPNTTGTYKDSSLAANGFSYTAGAAFDVTPWMTVYGTDAQGFIPLINVPFNGGLAPPYTSTTDEVGMKLQFLDRRLVITGALYDLTQSNVVQNLTPTLQVLGPGFRSRGVETDLQGEITQNLQAIASFSFARYQFESVSANNPDRVTGQPNLIASAMLNYTFHEGQLNGFSLGAGGHGVGPSYAADQITATSVTRIPGYAVADLYAGYHKGDLDINAKVSNIANKYYYFNSFNTVLMPVAPGRTFTLVLKKQF